MEAVREGRVGVERGGDVSRRCCKILIPAWVSSSLHPLNICGTNLRERPTGVAQVILGVSSSIKEVTWCCFLTPLDAAVPISVLLTLWVLGSMKMDCSAAHIHIYLEEKVTEHAKLHRILQHSK